MQEEWLDNRDPSKIGLADTVRPKFKIYGNSFFK